MKLTLLSCATDSQTAVTIEPGVNWLELYTAADQHGVIVAGGYSVGGTVGAGGGWPVGGGHSILSPYYGLGKCPARLFVCTLNPN